MWHAQFAHFADPAVTSLPEGWGIPPIRHYRNKVGLALKATEVFPATD